MTRFQVWAPSARRVALVLSTQRLPMTAGANGSWFLEVEGGAAGHGTTYAFAVNDGPPLPDPRSPWQPRGVHGPSCVVDHASFTWHDAAWRAPAWTQAVCYELHIGTFTPDGTFDAAIEHLDDLRDLGVTHLELMPVAQFPGVHGWGYDAVDLWAPHAPYGGPAGLQRFIDAAHGAGLAVLLDVVYNHLGPSGSYLGRFGPYASPHHTTPWGSAFNFDAQGCDSVRAFVIENACMWLRDYHADGLRLDAVHAMFDESPVHIVREIARAVAELAAELDRPLVVIGESNLNDPKLVRPAHDGGDGLDAQWSDDFHHAVHAVLTGERDGCYADFGTLAHVAKALTHGFVLDGIWSHYRRRRHGHPATGLRGSRLLGYLQTHDQVGNRPLGERITALVSDGRARMGAALVLLAPFTPLLFQGEEWAASSPFLYFTDHDDPALDAAVREGRRHEHAGLASAPDIAPDPRDPLSFQLSVLDWSERARSPRDAMLAWYRQLLALRRAEPALHDGNLHEVRVRVDEAARWLVMERGPVVLVANAGANVAHIALGASADLLLTSANGITLTGHVCALPADSAAVLRRG